VGDEVDAGSARLRVEAMDKLRIARVRLIRKPPA
jgi:CBS domain containing-hemolysin-like protein